MELQLSRSLQSLQELAGLPAALPAGVAYPLVPASEGEAGQAAPRGLAAEAAAGTPAAADAAAGAASAGAAAAAGSAAMAALLPPSAAPDVARSSRWMPAASSGSLRACDALCAGEQCG